VEEAEDPRRARGTAPLVAYLATADTPAGEAFRQTARDLWDADVRSRLAREDPSARICMVMRLAASTSDGRVSRPDLLRRLLPELFPGLGNFYPSSPPWDDGTLADWYARTTKTSPSLIKGPERRGIFGKRSVDRMGWIFNGTAFAVTTLGEILYSRGHGVFLSSSEDNAGSSASMLHLTGFVLRQMARDADLPKFPIEPRPPKLQPSPFIPPDWWERYIAERNEDMLPADEGNASPPPPVAAVRMRPGICECSAVAEWRCVVCGIGICNQHGRGFNDGTENDFICFACEKANPCFECDALPRLRCPCGRFACARHARLERRTDDINRVDVVWKIRIECTACIRTDDLVEQKRVEHEQREVIQRFEADSKWHLRVAGLSSLTEEELVPYFLGEMADPGYIDSENGIRITPEEMMDLQRFVEDKCSDTGRVLRAERGFYEDHRTGLKIALSELEELSTFLIGFPLALSRPTDGLPERILRPMPSISAARALTAARVQQRNLKFRDSRGPRRLTAHHTGWVFVATHLRPRYEAPPTPCSTGLALTSDGLVGNVVDEVIRIDDREAYLGDAVVTEPRMLTPCELRSIREIVITRGMRP
jgi:hypothetical protein